MKNSNIRRYTAITISILFACLFAPYSYGKSYEKLSTEELRSKAFEFDFQEKYQEAFTLFMEAAKRDDPESQYRIGTYYYYGHGITQNYENALFWLKKSANKSYSEAFYFLGNLYDAGDGVKKNEAMAIDYYTKSAASEDLWAGLSAFCIAQIYLRNNNKEKATEWLKQSADIFFKDHGSINKGVITQLNELGVDYDPCSHTSELKVKENTSSLRDKSPFEDLTIEEIREQAHKNNIEHNYEKAFSLFMEGAKRGDGISQYYLGSFYFNGIGIKKDNETSFFWIKQAAEKYTTRAMNLLGDFYLNGIGVSKNNIEAIKWYKLEIEMNGESANLAAFSLGNYFKNTDKNEAIKWYKKCADLEYNKEQDIDSYVLDCLENLGITYNPKTKKSKSISDSYATRRTSSKPSTQKSNSSQRTTSRPINWATDVIMPPVIDFSNMPFNSVGTYPVGGGYSGTIDGGSYNSGGGANSSNSASRCTWCNGTGKAVKNDNAPANFGISKPKQRCPECGEIYDPNVRNHYHQTCSHCHGTGLR